MKRTITPYAATPAYARRIRSILPQNEPPRDSYRIPVSVPDISAKERAYVGRAVRSSWISGRGDFVSRFENAFARNVSRTRYAVAVNSGTSALHLALIACGVAEGDEVIVPSFTMIATANAVRYCGATPVFVDSDPGTWNMDASSIERRITKRTKAIIPVHIYGLPADVGAVKKIAKRHGLWIIEDAAEAHGAEYDGVRVGGLGDIAAFSLYANKIITTGNGGMIATSNTKLADAVRTLRSHAFTPSRHFWHRYVGYSYEMSNLEAAVGLAQAERFESLVARRRNIAALYAECLDGIPGLTPQQVPSGYRSVFWMYGMLIDRGQFGCDRDALRSVLAKHGVETRAFFFPIHLQPPYYDPRSATAYPVSERLARDGMYLPSYSTLTDREVRYISTVIARCRTGSAKKRKIPSRTR